MSDIDGPDSDNDNVINFREFNFKEGDCDFGNGANISGGHLDEFTDSSESQFENDSCFSSTNATPLKNSINYAKNLNRKENPIGDEFLTGKRRVSYSDSDTDSKELVAAKNKFTQTDMSKSVKVRLNSLSNYFHWRIINGCLKFQLAAEKDSEVLQLAINRGFGKFKNTSYFLFEFKVLLALVLLLVCSLSTGYLIFGDKFWSYNALFQELFSKWQGDGTSDLPSEPWFSFAKNDDGTNYLVENFLSQNVTIIHLLLFVFSALLFGIFLTYLLLTVFKLFYYIRISYLVSALICSLEHSKLCIKNAVQYLSDYSNVNSGFNFAHKGLPNQVKFDSIHANMPLFRSLIEVLILDILSCQESCNQLPRDASANFLHLHLCDSVSVEKIIQSLQQQFDLNLDGNGDADVDDENKEGESHESSASNKLEAMVQLHYELVTEFYFNAVLSLAQCFFIRDDSKMRNGVVSVFKNFILNYDLTIAQNLERELDLVQDLFLGLDFDEDFTVPTERQNKKDDDAIRQPGHGFERSNWKSVMTSFNIHLKEVIGLSSQMKTVDDADERNVEIVKQRLIASLSCIDNLELILRSHKTDKVQMEDQSEGNDSPFNIQTPMVRERSNPVVEVIKHEDENKLNFDDIFLGNEKLDDQIMASDVSKLQNSKTVTSKEPLKKGVNDGSGEIDYELLEKKLKMSQKQILNELGNVMSHRVNEQKARENDVIFRKYGEEAVTLMGWDQTSKNVSFQQNRSNNVRTLSYVDTTSTSSIPHPVSSDGDNKVEFNRSILSTLEAASHTLPHSNVFDTALKSPTNTSAEILDPFDDSESSVSGHTFNIENSRNTIGARTPQDINSENNIDQETHNSDVPTTRSGDPTDKTQTGGCPGVLSEFETVCSDNNLKSDRLSSQVQSISSICNSHSITSHSEPFMTSDVSPAGNVFLETDNRIEGQDLTDNEMEDDLDREDENQNDIRSEIMKSIINQSFVKSPKQISDSNSPNAVKSSLLFNTCTQSILPNQIADQETFGSSSSDSGDE